MNTSIKTIFKEIFQVSFLKGKFNSKQIKLLFFIVFWFLIYITVYYYNNREIRTINKLETILTELKYESLTISSSLTEKTRPSQIEILIRRQGLDIKKAQTPPYLIKVH
jgi:hypothetical protein